MSDSQIQVVDAQTEDNLTGIVIEGNPYLYWLRVYKALGLTPNHARKVIERLEEGTHFISFSRTDFKEKYPTVYKSYTVIDTRASSVIFLTPEGYNRAIMEISTGYMDDPVVAAAIDQKKDEIANIYTRYQSGEVLSKAMDDKPALPGEAHLEYAPVAVVLKDQLAIADLMIARNVEPAIAHNIAFSNTEEITHCGDVLTPWRPLIQADPFLSEPALLTPRDIGMELGGMSAISINKILVKLGFQKKIGSEWTPTQSGKIYAKFVPQEIQHNRGVMRHMQLKWVPAVVEKIREKMFYEEKGQTGLFLGEISV